MERVARIGRSRRAVELRSAEAGVALAGVAQHVLRAVVEDGPVRMSDIARRLDSGIAAVSRQVTTLEQLGYVARKAGRGDRRETLVQATASGRGASKRLRRAADAIFMKRLEGWSPGDVDRLAELLERLGTDLTASTRND